jgi:hypothetical protein
MGYIVKGSMVFSRSPTRSASPAGRRIATNFEKAVNFDLRKIMNKRRGLPGQSESGCSVLNLFRILLRVFSLLFNYSWISNPRFRIFFFSPSFCNLEVPTISEIK